MRAKFKIGENVKAVRAYQREAEQYLGKQGKVIANKGLIIKGRMLYRVQIGAGSYPFFATELRKCK
jgi:hypothetical protein